MVEEKEIQKDNEIILRLLSRREVKRKNNILFSLAKQYGVSNYTVFNNYGYQGLYLETTNQIKRRKMLSYSDNILDYMGSEELIANLFRILQTISILKRKVPSNWNYACQTHFRVGTKIRELIIDLGGELPENLPTPNVSINDIEKDYFISNDEIFDYK